MDAKRWRCWRICVQRQMITAKHSPTAFVLFGPSHLTVLALAFVVPVVLALLTRRSEAAQRIVRYAFAALLLGNWVFWLAVFYKNGWLTIGDALPLNLCDWANIAVILALLTHNQRAYELGYFWALAGTLQGLLTPDTPFDFPEVRFIIFSIFHAGIIAAVLYLTFGARMRPYVRSLLPVAAWSIGYAVVAGITDWQLGTNYGFLRAKPANVSVFEFLPPWPQYIPVLVALGLVSMLIYYAPFFIYDRVKP